VEKKTEADFDTQEKKKRLIGREEDQ